MTTQRVSNRPTSRRRGAMLPMIAVTLIVLIIGVVLSIDVAYMHMIRAELRTATDAAARAGAETLARTQDPNEAIDSALEVAGLNNVSGESLVLRRDQVQLGSVSQSGGKLNFNANTAPFTAVRVVGDRSDGSEQGSVRLFFGGFLGQDNFQPTQVATASASVRDIALVLDISGSMNNQEQGLTRIQALKDAVSVFITEIKNSSPNSTLSLATYSTTAKRDIPLTADYDEIQNAVNNLTPGGFTNIQQGLLYGSNSLVQDPLTRDFASKTIIVMTDGRFNRGGNPINAARIATDRGHQIHTITFSSGANQGVMKNVANEGDGVHIHADDGGDLVAAFRDIAKALSVTLIE